LHGGSLKITLTILLKQVHEKWDFYTENKRREDGIIF